MPGALITRQDIANAAVSAQPRRFDKFGGKQRAARVFFYFLAANRPTAMPHALGRKPTSWRPVSVSRDGVPGVIYAPIAASAVKGSDAFNYTAQYITLACETANTWAEIEVT